jgi:hypothetical protein
MHAFLQKKKKLLQPGNEQMCDELEGDRVGTSKSVNRMDNESEVQTILTAETGFSKS